MLSIPLGPFALPLAPVLLLVSVWMAAWTAARLCGRAAAATADDGVASSPFPAAAASDAIFHAALLGLLAARLAHLALNADLYAATPLSAFDLRDGGWHGPSGALAGAAWLAWRAWRAPLLRLPLAAGAALGVALWFAATLAAGTRDAAPLPPIVLSDLADGSDVPLPAAARGRPVVVNLWASWCGPCRQEMPLLAQAQQAWPGVGFLFVNQGESAEAIRRYLSAEKLELRHVLLDRGSQLGPAVGSRGLPTTLFYDASGRRVGAHFGVLNAAALEGRLRALRGAR